MAEGEMCDPLLLDFGHFPRNQVAGKWQPDEGLLVGLRRLSHVVMSTSPPDFTE
jgi:hypothetical protein